MSNSKPEDDVWREDKTCSFCGSLHPDEFFRLVEEGRKLTPTDKSYKAYVEGSGSPSGKFYFQHLDETAQKKLIDLVNEKKIVFAEPGFFYVPPFFTRPAPREG